MRRVPPLAPGGGLGVLDGRFLIELRLELLRHLARVPTADDKGGGPSERQVEDPVLRVDEVCLAMDLVPTVPKARLAKEARRVAAGLRRTLIVRIESLTTPARVETEGGLALRLVALLFALVLVCKRLWSIVVALSRRRWRRDA